MSEGGDSSPKTPTMDDTVICIGCGSSSFVDNNYVCCDRCDCWWHMTCAGVTDSVASRTWVCRSCLPPAPPSVSVTITSTSSARQARLQLQLQRLNEMRELEKMAMNVELERKFLERKYQMMEQSLKEDEEESRGNRSRTSTKDIVDRNKDIADWVEKHSSGPNSVKTPSVKSMVKKIEKVTITDPKIPADDEQGAVGGTDAKDPAVPTGNVADTKAGTEAPRHQKPATDPLPEQNTLVPENALQLLQQQGGMPPLTLDQVKVMQNFLLQYEKQLQPAEAVQKPPGTDKPSVPDVSKGAIPKTKPPVNCPPKQSLPPPKPNQVSPKPANKSSDKIPKLPLPVKPRKDAVEPHKSRAHEQPENSESLPGQSTQPEKQRPPKPKPLPAPLTDPESVPRPDPVPEQLPNPVPTPVPTPLPDPAPVPPPEPVPIANRGGQNNAVGPTQQQLAARQVLPRDLPNFSGNPADWPVFISQYNYTTDACGYSDGENMIRLQRCLKGPAWESVRSRLILPASVPLVIQTLKMRYGRSDLLIESLVEKVKSAPSPKVDKLETIIEFGTMVQALCDHIVAAQLNDHLANPTLLKDLVEKLPAEYRMRWAGHRRQQAEVNLKTFSDFMEEIVSDAYSVHNVSVAFDRNKQDRPQDRPKQRDRSLIHAEATRAECLICKREGHHVKECRIFQAFSVDDRWKKVQNLQLCRTCLSSHGRRACRSAKRCGVDGCEYRHNPLLHSGGKKQEKSSENHVQYHLNEGSIPSLLFRILPITLHNGPRTIETFAFLDEGSSVTMIESSLAKELGVTGYKKPLCLKWTGDMTREEPDSERISIFISGSGNPKRFRMDDVRTIQTLDLPRQSLPIDDLMKIYTHLAGIPIRGYHNAVPKLLIGVDNLKLALPLKAREGDNGGPTAVKTRLGWCVYGGQRTQGRQEYTYHICECGGDEVIEDALKTFFSFEEAGIKPRTLTSEEDKRALRILEETTKRVGDHLETGLLWRYDNFEFPDSYPMAVKRLQCLENRMAKNPALKQNIVRQIAEYQQKGYAHRATETELAEADPRRTWFLPLGAVTNPNKPDKIRLIWDAAAKVDGISLNLFLLKGPDMVTPLCFVIFKFRQHRTAVGGDLKEMFHQVFTRKADQAAQSFLFRDDPSKEPEVYRMCVATFGATCSPVIAQYVKNVNARSFEKEFPRAVEAIVDNHYVDDYVDSFPTEDEAKRVASEVREIHRKGGFEIRNWCSNSPEVLRHLGETKQQTVKQMCMDEKENSERVLGIRWTTESDEFCFSATMRREVANIIENNLRPTKRQILRCVMSLFDPLGLLAPFLVFGKVLIQAAWRLGIGWDEKVDDDLFDQWRHWTQMIEHINSVRIPRWYLRESGSRTPLRIELHTFVDAGRDACACVSYFRAVFEDGEVKVALASAKTKVVPLKPITIPRLELQACVMGARLAKFVIEGHSYSISKRVFWSDSSSALSWIRADPRKYSPYVSYRVAEILETTNRNEWRWVASEENPADEATKWGAGPYFNSNSIWYSGPRFLYLPEEEWTRGTSVEAGREELRAFHLHRELHVPECIVDIDRFSKWTHLQRVMAHVHRFINNCRRNRRKSVGNLTQKELKTGEDSIFRLVQWQVFPDEMVTLFRNRSLPLEQRKSIQRSSRIYNSTPMLDECGVLRVDGRIEAAQCVSNEVKYPVILPKKHPLARLLVDYYHQRFNHGNGETIVNEIRQRFDIPSLRTLVRSVSSRCYTCKTRNPQPIVQLEGPLPQSRLTPFTRPFSYVGLDYFGPFLVKVGRSKVKRWIALFTCMTVRAVHLEVANSLTTESCVACVRRFVCRRGFPIEICSDNGTNFQGAERVLREQINSKLAATFTSTTTTWRFIPPGAPHMGGAWERLVRSVKAAMTAAYNNEKLDDEALHTMVVEAESIVNSRPLTYLPLDSAEQEAITPNHFLLGSSTGVKQPAVEDIDSCKLLKRSWLMIQERLNSFWKRWVREYLPTLTKRTKWFGPTKNLEAGDLVIIIDDTRRNGWTRGRVLQPIVPADGRVRQAIVQTSGGLIRRPVSKLAVLDVTKGDGTEEDHGFHRGEDVASRTD